MSNKLKFLSETHFRETFLLCVWIHCKKLSDKVQLEGLLWEDIGLEGGRGCVEGEGMGIEERAVLYPDGTIAIFCY